MFVQCTQTFSPFWGTQHEVLDAAFRPVLYITSMLLYHLPCVYGQALTLMLIEFAEQSAKLIVATVPCVHAYMWEEKTWMKHIIIKQALCIVIILNSSCLAYNYVVTLRNDFIILQSV